MLAQRPSAYEGWPEARRAAWDALPEQTDEYYFRYLPPHENASPSEEWSAKETASFQRLLREHPEKVAEGKWGLLSMHHPGRTGAECKARYERLTDNKEDEAPQNGLDMWLQEEQDEAARAACADTAGAASGHHAAARPTPATGRNVARDPLLHAAHHALGPAAGSPVPPFPSASIDSDDETTRRAALGGTKRGAAAAAAAYLDEDGDDAARPSSCKYARVALALHGRARAMLAGAGASGGGSADADADDDVAAATAAAAAAAAATTTTMTSRPDAPTAPSAAEAASEASTDEGGASASDGDGETTADAAEDAVEAELPLPTMTSSRPPSSLNVERPRPSSASVLRPSPPPTTTSALAPYAAGKANALLAPPPSSVVPPAAAVAAAPPVVRSARAGDTIPCPSLPPPFVTPAAACTAAATDAASSSTAASGGTALTPHADAPPSSSSSADLPCVSPAGAVRTREALAMSQRALEALRSHQRDLLGALEASLSRELGPNLGGACGLLYPTFTSLDALALAVNAAPRLAATAIAAHKAALTSSQHPGRRLWTGGEPRPRAGTDAAAILTEAHPHAAAAAAGAAAAAQAATAVGAQVLDGTLQRIAALLGAYESARADAAPCGPPGRVGARDAPVGGRRPPRGAQRLPARLRAIRLHVADPAAPPPRLASRQRRTPTPHGADARVGTGGRGAQPHDGGQHRSHRRRRRAQCMRMQRDTRVWSRARGRRLACGVILTTQGSGRFVCGA